MLGESLGAGLGCIFTLIFVDSNELNDPETIKQQILKLCYTITIIFTVLYTISLLILKEKPPIPPRYLSE